MAAELRLIRRRAAQIIPLKTSKLCLLSFRTAFSFSLPPTSSELQRESYLIMESWNSVSVSLEPSLCFELGPVFYKEWKSKSEDLDAFLLTQIIYIEPYAVDTFNP